jgi:hypothetical protein
MRPYEPVYTAATIRVLLAERDAAIAASRKVSRKAGEWRDIAKRKDVVIKQLEAKLCAASLDMLAANDAPLLDAEDAYRAGAEAMRRAAQGACQAAFQPAPAMHVTTVNAVRAGIVLCVKTIRALPLPKMEDKTND